MFPKTDILSLRPFEIASIRPPTENYSLAFRLTRNCYWNKCAFCPVYKLGARFSRRGPDEVIEDIARAKALDDYLFERGIGNPVYSSADGMRLDGLAEEIAARQREAGLPPGDPVEEITVTEDTDPRMKWFLSWFNSRPDLGECMRHILAWRIDGGKTCFLGDADSLILDPGFLAKVIGAIRLNFPSLQRFTVYGRTSTAARLRSEKELRACARAGLNRVHFGLESGSDRVLALVNKGVTADEHVRGCAKVKEAGLSCSVYVMPGLGGCGLSDEHARGTADVINRIAPDFMRLRTLEIFPQTGLDDLARRGEFTEASEEQVAREIRHMVEGITVRTEIMSDSATNLLDVSGSLPDDRAAMLGTIDSYLSLDAREKLEFSLNERLRSFTGQYGGITGDIYEALSPLIRKDRLDCSLADDETLVRLTRLIRSKLMP